jgi:Zn finger protein HypA/HybF involved in hydrogenase expression
LDTTDFRIRRAEVRFKCPSCQKSYSTELAAFEALPDKTAHRHLGKRLVFECVTCKTQFSARLLNPAEAATQILPTRVPLNKSPGGSLHQTQVLVPARKVPLRPDRVTCPKCKRENPRGAKDCPGCGVVFAKYRGEVAEERMASDAQLAERPELISLWNETVVSDYNNTAVHERFIEACRAANSLAFAAYKYKRVLEAAPEEEIARAMQKRVVALVSHPFERKARARIEFRLPGFNGLAIALSSAVLTMGLMLKNMQNLTAIGASMLALTLLMRLVLKK